MPRMRCCLQRSTQGGDPGQSGAQPESGGKESRERRSGKAGEWEVKGP